MFRSWLREMDETLRKRIAKPQNFRGLVEASKRYLGADPVRYTSATLPLLFAIHLLGGRSGAYFYWFPQFRGKELRTFVTPFALLLLLARAPDRLNFVRLAQAIAAPGLDVQAVRRARMPDTAISRAQRAAAQRFATKDALMRDVIAGTRNVRADYPYGAEIMSYIAKAQDSLGTMDKFEVCAVLEVVRRTLAVYVAAAEVGQAVQPGVDAHMALRMRLMKTRGEPIPIVDVAAAYPHLSFRDFKRAARTLQASFPQHIIYDNATFTIEVTQELPRNFVLAPLREVSAAAIMPTSIEEMDALTARLARQFRLTGPHPAPTMAETNRVDPANFPTRKPAGPDHVAATT